MFIVLKNICGCRSKQCIVTAFLLALVFFIIRFIPDLSISAHTGRHHSHQSGQQDGPPKASDNDHATDTDQSFIVIGDNHLEPVPDWLTRESLCPACFGADICKDVKHKLQIQFPDDIDEWQGNLGKVKFYAKWGKAVVVVRTLVTNDTFVKYDKFLCKTVNQEEDRCETATAVVHPQSPAVMQESFLPSNLESAWKIAHSRRDALPFTYCASKDLIRSFTAAVDTDHDNKLTRGQVAMLYTSLVLNPDAVLLRFFSQLPQRLPVPRMLGACGRVVVVEDYGKSLLHYMDASWEMRAELALQILEMIDSFVNTDPNWAFFSLEFHLKDFYIIEDRELLLVPLDRLVIVDKLWKHTVEAEQDYGDWSGSVCNTDCFSKFLQGLQHASQQQDQTQQGMHMKEHQVSCAQAPPIGRQLMQHIACKKIFSDLESDRHSRTYYQTERGLLNEPPEEVAEEIGQLLHECSEESEGAGRQEAVTQLKDTLQKYASTLEEEG